jgi:cytoskeletal protein CcmA (bactofilin family)
LDGITAGTVTASKSVVVDANKDITGFRNITATGDVDIDGTTNLDIVDIDGAVNIAAATTIATDNKIQFRDTGLYINSSADGQLDLVADTEIQIAATTIDIDGAVVLNGAITGATDITLSGELDAATLDISGNADIDGTLEADVLTVDGAAAKVAGLETIYVPSNAMYPNTTNGCAFATQVELSNGPEIKVLDFDPSSDENAQFTVCFPKSWNEGTITFQPFWTVTGTDTGTVAWGLSGVSIANDGSINTAFGTNVVTTAKAFSGTSNDLMVSDTSGAVTIASAAVDTQTYFQIMRDVSADSQTGDARLLGIKLYFTTDAKNDA